MTTSFITCKIISIFTYTRKKKTKTTNFHIHLLTITDELNDQQIKQNKKTNFVTKL